ncbi:MAG: PDZ domain-containing protein, partial [bacterium]|nr:PDZ domain-containing protein [bacterium]
MYTRIAERIQKDYVEESTPQELLEGALKGLLNSLDPHSTFLSVNKMKALRQNISGRFGGVGIEITMKDSLPLIVAPIDDSPAKEKDLRPGDFIIMIDEKPIGEKDINDIVDQLRGDVGAPVTLTIRRKDTTPFDVTLNRAIIKVKPVKWRVEGGDMGYIRITNFSGNNTKLEIVKAIHAIQSKLKDTLKGFVLDMRNNAGGLLNQAVDVADIFLKSGEVVSTKGRRPEET